jgi:hypothetical protein
VIWPGLGEFGLLMWTISRINDGFSFSCPLIGFSKALSSQTCVFASVMVKMYVHKQFFYGLLNLSKTPSE